MNADITVRIDRIAVDIGQERRAEQVEETVKKALVLLAARLANAPLGLGGRAPSLALDRLELEPLDADGLTGPGAADRLAEAMYRTLLEASTTRQTPGGGAYG